MKIRKIRKLFKKEKGRLSEVQLIDGDAWHENEYVYWLECKYIDLVNDFERNKLQALNLAGVMPSLFAVCWINYKNGVPNMLAIHTTRKDAEINCNEWNKIENIHYVAPVKLLR